MNYNNMALLISSYDKAEDLWNPLEESYIKYWGDNPFKIYLATNNLNPKMKLFNILNIGKEKSWSDNILKCLNRINEEYIILTFDDLFLYKNIDTKLIIKYADRIIDNNWDYLRLHPSPKADLEIDEYVGKISPNRPYRSSTVFAIFKKEVFKELLVDTESAWEFERNASLRSNKYEHFYVSTQTVCPYLNAVVKGKWIPSVLKYLKKEKYSLREEKRKKMNLVEIVYEKFKRLRLKLFFNLVPRKLQVKFRQYLDSI